jgi:uncharacterized protein
MKIKRLLLILVVTLIVLGSPTKVMSAETYTNRLIHEKSPYLLQHAHNPVNWYPWGEEAVKKAKAEDKPIFLSVGYSTCHWCHVMEDESFSSPEIAKIMNDNFVSIKVDREERPDVDNIYMQAVMAMTGSGGWPMTVFLTQDLKPFYGGTYFPPDDRWGRPGLVSVLNGIAAKWKTSRSEILKSGDSLAQAIHAQSQKGVAAAANLDESVLKKGFEQFKSRFDSRFGGFGGAPKFPSSHNLLFLLRYWKRTGNSEALQMVEKTLQEIAKGGIHDHIGGGFHRYSTDARWHVPHFEKMLYDQAILARAYLETYQATGKKEYAETARDIFEYVLRDMTDKGGAFYSAEDADSPDPKNPSKKVEGAFYAWEKSEIEKILTKEEAKIFFSHYGVDEVLYATQTPSEVTKSIRQKLFEARNERPRPHLDDKILTDWNGLMISSLAFGSRVLNEPRYADAARKAADFIMNNMKRKDGRLLHRYRDGEASIPGFIEDYAFFSHGLFDLYEATFDPKYLEESQRVTKEMARLFWDDLQGGFFFTANDSEKLIARTKELYDGAIPSGNSIAVLSLLRVGGLTMDRELETRARHALDAFSSDIVQYPSAYPQTLTALDFAIGPSREIVIAGNENDPTVQAMIRETYSRFMPNKVVILHPPEGTFSEMIEKLSPFLKNQNVINGKPTAYVCKNYVCNLPTTDLAKLKELLSDSQP